MVTCTHPSLELEEFLLRNLEIFFGRLIGLGDLEGADLCWIGMAGRRSTGALPSVLSAEDKARFLELLDRKPKFGAPCRVIIPGEEELGGVLLFFSDEGQLFLELRDFETTEVLIHRQVSPDAKATCGTSRSIVDIDMEGLDLRCWFANGDVASKFLKKISGGIKSVRRQSMSVFGMGEADISGIPPEFLDVLMQRDDVDVEALVRRPEEIAYVIDKISAAAPKAEVTTSSSAASSSASSSTSASASSSSRAESDAPTSTGLACVVCLDAEPQLAVIPCGHYCLCQSCWEQLGSGQQNTCVVCRGPVQDMLRIYNP